MTPPATPPAATPEPGPAPLLRANALAETVERSTAGLAQTVQSVGAGAPAAAPVTDLLGGTVAGTGAAVGGLVRVLSGEQR